MTAQTGRTTFKYVNFIIGDSSNVLRTLEINTLSVIGFKYDELDLTAWSDAVKGSLPTWPDAPIEFGGPWSNAAAATVGTPSGSHTVLAPLNGDATPRTIDIQFGVRHAWESGEPQFGISRSATAGYIITNFTVDPKTMTYSARAVLIPGSTAPAWGTAAET